MRIYACAALMNSYTVGWTLACVLYLVVCHLVSSEADCPVLLIPDASASGNPGHLNVTFRSKGIKPADVILIGAVAW